MPARHRGWIDFDVDASVEGHRLYWVHTAPVVDRHATQLHWRYRRDLPTGTLSAWCRPGSSVWNYAALGRQKPFYVFCVRLTPQSTPYEATNVLSGVTRPETWTNCWVSDSRAPGRPWIELRWDAPVAVGRVEITFDTNLSETNEVMPPFAKASRCVRDYSLLVHTREGWRKALSHSGNYQRRVVHEFPAVEATAIRLEVETTNGDPSARVYEVRAYAA